MAAKAKDYYAVLGVAPRTHARVIEETYWERAHELHGVPTRKAQQRLGALNEAYEILASPHKRAEYDRRRIASDAARDAAGRRNWIESALRILSKPFRPD